MRKISKKRSKELAALAALPDREIELIDLPEALDWRRAVVGKFCRPMKKRRRRRA